jgi:hypothetical protein
MLKRRQISIVLVGALAACAISHADMVRLSPLDAAGCLQAPQANALADLRPASSSLPFAASPPGIGDLDSLPTGFLPYSDPRAEPTSETKPVQILTDRQNSRTLCLYALLSLGLWQSTPLVKRFHFSCIPEWYHNGGPSQLGHSFAVSPDCLPRALVACFLQADGRSKDVAPQYSSGAIAALLRKSQFTPTTLASRGPPYRS